MDYRMKKPIITSCLSLMLSLRNNLILVAYTLWHIHYPNRADNKMFLYLETHQQ
ncbi:hypothetical protein Lmac_2871 [Legionella maceachernii]|uniref:Uncharacterized protein n=1 Tax=Legionella maceachernii TaxID=466 RepID=A0A0W0VVD1_9GAMM|nr:hypothetical protein Lmac_2871 [Legionella maceachernii]SKA19396.1 hypothetical protein SAMN02745128_02498 [Legionella maceachernii]SUP04363.1 Uncharacterised protein [Legionella maceachernii]